MRLHLSMGVVVHVPDGITLCTRLCAVTVYLSGMTVLLSCSIEHNSKQNTEGSNTCCKHCDR